MKKTVATLAVGALLAGALVAAVPASAKKAPKGPTSIGTDPAGDWGAAVDPTLAPVGDALGMDLPEAFIQPDGANLNFIIKLNSLPAVGGTPEVARYSWDLFIDGEPLELDGKFTNYSRGTCDPTSGTCPPPRDPGMQPFFVRGNCTETDAGAGPVITCEELATVQAAFDPAEGTITIPVPMELISAKPGSKITGGTGLDGGTIETHPAAFLSRGGLTSDSLTQTGTYVIPKK